LLNASIAFGQSIICSSCNKEVEGDYLKIGNKYFHPDHFVCDYCKKLLPDRFMSDNSKYYHSECYAEVKGLKCEYCKKIIADEYMISQNKKYHKRCYEQISPKCRICDKTLVGTFSVDYYGNKYHSYHENEFPRCTCCHRLISKSITNGGRNYSDGRSICNICFSDAIFDQGRISDFKVEKKGEEFGLSYKNEAGNFRQIGFLPRDLSIDGKVLSIDTAILSATKKENSPLKNSAVSDNFLKWSFVSVVQKIFEFLIFLSLVIVLPGFVLTHRAFKKDAPAFLRIFISAAVGFVVLTLLFYITSLLRIRFLVFVYILMNLIIFLHLKLYSNIKKHDFKLVLTDKIEKGLNIKLAVGNINDNERYLREKLIQERITN